MGNGNPSDTVEHAIIPVPMELMHTEPESTTADSNSALMDDSFFIQTSGTR